MFVNTLLAEEWKEELGEGVESSELMARAEAFSLDAMPIEVLWITAGVDVQHDRLECSLLGHTASADMLVLDHRTFWGSPHANETWAELDDLLRATWPHPHGGRIGISAAAVDSGDGATTDVVNAYTRPRFGRRVVSVKGDGGNRPTLAASKSQGSRLYIVGVDGVKANLLTRLKNGASIRFSDKLDAEYYLQLTSERRVVKWSRGQPTHLWERIVGRRAEALDCFVYGWAARNLIQADPQRRENELREIVKASATPAVVRSKWMQGER